jgi:hypothetical protein
MTSLESLLQYFPSEGKYNTGSSMGVGYGWLEVTKVRKVGKMEFVQVVWAGSGEK